MLLLSKKIRCLYMDPVGIQPLDCWYSRSLDQGSRVGKRWSNRRRETCSAPWYTKTSSCRLRYMKAVIRARAGHDQGSGARHIDILRTQKRGQL